MKFLTSRHQAASTVMKDPGASMRRKVYRPIRTYTRCEKPDMNMLLFDVMCVSNVQSIYIKNDIILFRVGL